MTSYIKKLPSVFQTVTEKKFFNATVDQVFSKKDSDLLYGYLGQRIPGYYNPVADFYIPEPTKDRTWWQLEPTAFSRNPDSTKTNIFFYDDLLNRINYYGGNTLNQDRLFESEYYSWAPPIDYDMFINYQNYYWVDAGLTPISITGVMYSDIVGQPTYTTPITAFPPNMTLTTGLTIVLVDDTNHPGYYTVENIGNGIGIRLIQQMPSYTSGSAFEFIPWDGTVQLLNGRQVQNINWDTTTWDVEPQPGNTDYITLERGCIDENAWSRTNKWFNIAAINQTIELTGIAFPPNASRALRPIIQFCADLALYNSGTQFKNTISYGFLGNVQGLPLLLSSYQGRPKISIDTELNIELQQNQLAIFMEDPAQKENVLSVNIDNSGIVTFMPYGTPAVTGDIVFATDDAPFNGMLRGQTYYYDTGNWVITANNKISTNQAPLFKLFDHNNISLDDPVRYPNSTFAGSEIFSYKINTTPGATVDPVLKFPIMYTSLGQASDILFQNNLITDRYMYGDTELNIDGYYYYTSVSSSILYNGWNLYSLQPVANIPPITTVPDAPTDVVATLI